MRTLFWLFAFLVFVAACKKENPGPLHYFVLPADSDCAPVTLDSFPLAPGHIWIYSTGDTMSTFGDTTINGASVTRLKIAKGAKEMTYYLRNASTGLSCDATQGNPSEINLHYMSWPDDSLHFSPLLIAQHPVVLTDTFYSREYGYYPNDLFYSRWLAFKRITTPAGSFDCAVLMVQSSGAQSWYRYYSAKGLVREISVVTYGSKVKEDSGFYYSTYDLINVNF